MLKRIIKLQNIPLHGTTKLGLHANVHAIGRNRAKFHYRISSNKPYGGLFTFGFLHGGLCEGGGSLKTASGSWSYTFFCYK